MSSSAGRTKKFIINSISTAMLQIVTMLVGFILPKVMLKYYGSEINGLVSSITQFMAYFSLVEAGLSGAAVFALYKPLAQKDNNGISQVVTQTRKFYIKAGLIFGLLVLSLGILYPLFVTSTLLSKFEITLLVFVIGLSVVIDFFTLSKYRVLLTADQKIYVISIASILYYVFNTLIISVLSIFKYNIIIVRFIAITAVLIRSFILKIYVEKKYPLINYNEKITKKNLLSKRWDALYLQILGAVELGAPVIILTFTTNLITVSIYTIYNMILSGINGVLSIFTSGLSASFGDVIAREEFDKLKKTTLEFEYGYYNLITLVYSVAMVLIMPFIKLYVGSISDVNYYIPILGILFIINGFLYNIKTPQGMLVISAGMYKETRIQSTIQGLIIIAFGFLLAPKYGIIGMMIANILSNLYRTIDLLFFIPRNLTKQSFAHTLFRQVKSIIYFILIYFTSVFVVSKLNISINSYFNWIIIAIISLVIGLFIIFFSDLLVDRKMMNNIYQRMRGLLNNGKSKKDK